MANLRPAGLFHKRFYAHGHLGLKSRNLATLGFKEYKNVCIPRYKSIASASQIATGPQPENSTDRVPSSCPDDGSQNENGNYFCKFPLLVAYSLSLFCCSQTVTCYCLGRPPSSPWPPPPRTRTPSSSTTTTRCVTTYRSGGRSSTVSKTVENAKQTSDR